MGLLLYPAALCLLILIAAAHTALGSPLGLAFNSELWGMVKSLGLTFIAYGPLAAKVWAVNAVAAENAKTAVPPRAPHPPSLPYERAHTGRGKPHGRNPRPRTGSQLALPSKDHHDPDDYDDV